MSDHVEAIVVGAGVVGLAIATELARRGREVIVLERNEHFGMETSSRNSEVIHAGIYYPTGSLKARFCVAGRDELYRFCESHKVPHARCGKLIVATTDEEAAALGRIEAQALKNGVHDIRPLSTREIAEMEPDIRAVAALYSPSTGIIDSHGLMVAYLGELEANGGVIAYASSFAKGCVTGDGFLIETPEMTLACDILINSAGLDAQGVAKRLEGLPPESIPALYLSKGSYFTVSRRLPFSHLIYPVPLSASLGVHVTLDLAGAARFGPDQQWIEEIDYDIDATRAEAFYEAIRRYYPDLPDGCLQPGYTGIRPKLQAPGEPAKDFMIQGPSEHGVARLVNLYGIESPGLTASPAIARHVADMLT